MVENNKALFTRVEIVIFHLPVTLQYVGDGFFFTPVISYILSDTANISIMHRYYGGTQWIIVNAVLLLCITLYISSAPA